MLLRHQRQQLAGEVADFHALLRAVVAVAEGDGVEQFGALFAERVEVHGGGIRSAICRFAWFAILVDVLSCSPQCEEGESKGRASAGREFGLICRFLPS